jgi:putative transposase
VCLGDLAGVPTPPGRRILAGDCCTVDTILPRRVQGLFVIDLGSRRVHRAGVTAHPTGWWAAQQARDLVAVLDDQATAFRLLLGDRDTKFSRAFDNVWRSTGAEIIGAPVRAPNPNAVAERWVGSVRRECLDQLLLVGCRQLGGVLGVYVEHDNRHRPHRSLVTWRPYGRCLGSRGADRSLAACAGATCSVD